MSWSDGYHVEAEYTSGYYKELSPTMQRFAALLNGYALPLASDDDVHMELGFGQGVSINVHAAVQPGGYIGNDFNPSHALHAQSMALASGAKADFTDESFAQLAARQDLPMCSSISFHGIWSWINDENRQHMLNIIKRCLKPGGVVYNSYNVLHGHAAFMPWREMMCRYFEQQSGSALDRIEATIAHFNQIFEESPSLLESNPALKTSWARVSKANRQYLLHEYFNANWDCFSVLQVSEVMEDAKLQFIGSINNSQYTNHITLNQQALARVQAHSSILQAESWRDAFTSNTFRRDVYVKGGRHVTQAQMISLLNDWRFVMIVEVSKFGNHLYSQQDQRQFNQDLFEPVRDKLAQDDYAPKTFAQLLEGLDKSKYNWSNLLQLLLVKMETSQIQVCSVHEVTDKLIQQARRLNESMLQELDFNVSNMYVASAVTGQALTIDLVAAWALRNWMVNPKASNKEIAEQIWQCLQRNGRLLLDADGEKLNGKEAHLASLHQSLKIIRDSLPIWKQLGLCD